MSKLMIMISDEKLLVQVEVLVTLGFGPLTKTKPPKGIKPGQFGPELPLGPVRPLQKGLR